MTGEIKRGDESFTLSGTVYDFMMQEGRNGYSSATPFAPRQSQGERSYADYDVTSSIIFTAMTGGFGQDRATDLTAFFNSRNVDARGGRLILGPLPHLNQATPSGLSSHADGLLDGTFTGDTLGFHYAYSTATQKIAAYFDCPTDVNDLHRIWLPVKATVAAGAITVGLYNSAATPDGIGEPGSSITTATVSKASCRQFGGWVEAAFSAPASVAPGSRYWVTVEHSGTDTTAVGWYGASSTSTTYRNCKVYDGASWTASASNWHMIFWTDDSSQRPDGPLHWIQGTGEDGILRLWAYAGRRFYYIGADGLPVAVEDGAGAKYEALADITDTVFFQGTSDAAPFVYFGQGTGSDMLKFDGDVVGTETWAAISSIKASKLAVHDNYIWRIDEDGAFSGSVDGATYGTPIAVGDLAYGVRSLISWNGFLYAGKDDGLYKCTYTVGAPPAPVAAVKALDFGPQADNNNFSWMEIHQGDLYFPIGQGIMRYTTGDVLTPVTPDTGLNLAASQRSLPKAGFSSLGTLWVAMEGPPDGDSTILAYENGAWFPLITAPRKGDMIRGLHGEPGLYGDIPRLWYGNGLQVAYAQIPFTTSKRWTWEDADWQVTGYLDFSWVDGNLRTINKDWISVKVHVEKVSAVAGGAYVQVWYREDDTTAWAQVGANITTEGVQSVSFASSTYGGKVQLRVYLYRGTFGSDTVTPQVQALEIKYLERPPSLYSFTRTYRWSDDMVWRSGEPSNLTFGEWMTNLVTLRDSAEPLSYTHRSGLTRSVHIVRFNVMENWDTRDMNDHGTALAALELVEV